MSTKKHKQNYCQDFFKYTQYQVVKPYPADKRSIITVKFLHSAFACTGMTSSEALKVGTSEREYSEGAKEPS